MTCSNIVRMRPLESPSSESRYRRDNRRSARPPRDGQRVCWCVADREGTRRRRGHRHHWPRCRSVARRRTLHPSLRLERERLRSSGRRDRCGAPDRMRHASHWRHQHRLARRARRRAHRLSDLEVSSDGSCIVTKPHGTGGCVTPATVKEQLVYEIGDPTNYLSPDVAVSFLSLAVEDQGNDRVRVSGATGSHGPTRTKSVPRIAMAFAPPVRLRSSAATP